MNPKNVVVNNALNYIKHAPPRQHCAKQNPAIPWPANVTRGTKEHRRSNQRHQPESQMKKTILFILKLKLLDGCGLTMRGYTDQMMPAQYLMKNDPIRKASEPQAENNACLNQWMF